MMAKSKAMLPRYWGWRFNYALDTLKRAYQSARAEARKEQQSIDERYKVFEASRDAGPSVDEDPEDWNDQMGHWDTHLTDEWQEAEDCLRLVTEAFIIALFHLWERQVKRAMRQEKYEHDKAIGWLKSVGLKPVPKKLMELKFAAETLKHSEGSSACKLYQMRPDLFDGHLATDADEADYESMRVKDATFHDFFEAVRASGPTDRNVGFDGRGQVF